MTARITLQPSGHAFSTEPGETLLEGALRAGLNVNYHCNNGTCGDCRARLIAGKLCRVDSHDFRFTRQDKAQGWFLLCRAHADSDVTVETVEAEGIDDIPVQQVSTQVTRIEYPSDDIALLQLRTPRSQTLRFLAGQHATLRIADLEPRNKSIASCPCNGMVLQFHVRKVADDRFSEYVFNCLRNRDRVEVQGPFGDFVLDEDSQRPIVFLAYETGFAPIKSVIEHAISLDLPQPIRLYWVARHEGDHYLANYCRSWEQTLDAFRYIPLVAQDNEGARPAGAGVAGLAARERAMLNAAGRVVEDLPDLSGHDVYVNGPESMLGPTTELLLRHGLPENRLFIDHVRRF